MRKDDDNPTGLLIPIGVLLIVFIATGVVWLFIPILILGVIFLAGMSESSKIQKRKRKIDHWTAPDEDTSTYSSGTAPEYSTYDEKPIYEREKQKDEGIACGLLIPIAILGWLYAETEIWVFIIPIFFLVLAFFQSICKFLWGKAKVLEATVRGDSKSVAEISRETGMPEDRVRRHIVREKRGGSTEIWFDPSTGETTHAPVRTVEPTREQKRGCLYCGFALKPGDRYCPYCGAPIMADSYE